MKPLLKLITLLSICFSGNNFAIEISQLQDLSLKFVSLKQVDKFPGQNLAAEVSLRPGEDFTLYSPATIQQIHFLVINGQKVTKGTPIAALSGPEIHHFVMEYEFNKQLMKLLEARYQKNKELLKLKAINEKKWIEISKQYLTVKLEFGHMSHFMDLVSNINEEDDTITITAPEDGLINLNKNRLRFVAEEAIFSIVPLQSIRLKISLPIKFKNVINQIKTEKCELEVNQVSGIAEQSFVTAWTETIKPSCELSLGERLTATPSYSLKAWIVPKQAIFNWNENNQIFVKNDQQLEMVEVKIHGARNNQYYISTKYSLEGKQILNSSVSAAKGILQGLGGE